MHDFAGIVDDDRATDPELNYELAVFRHITHIPATLYLYPIVLDFDELARRRSRYVDSYRRFIGFQFIMHEIKPYLFACGNWNRRLIDRRRFNSQFAKRAATLVPRYDISVRIYD